MKHNTKKGFTLVELLVVIAILAILATVSVVGYTSFIERANVAADQNEVTQLNHFLAVLKSDNSSKFFNKDLNEWNVRAATKEILDMVGWDELNPRSGENGYNIYFNFDKQEYILAQDTAVINGTVTGVSASPLTSLLGFSAGERGETLGNSMSKGGRYFLVSTAGNALANFVEKFYNLGVDAEDGEFKGYDGDKVEDWRSEAGALGSDYDVVKDFVNNASVANGNDAHHPVDGENKHLIYPDNSQNQIPDTTLVKDETSGKWVPDNSKPIVSGDYLAVPDDAKSVSEDTLKDLESAGTELGVDSAERLASMLEEGRKSTDKAEGTKTPSISIKISTGETISIGTEVKTEGGATLEVSVVIKPDGATVECSFSNPVKDFYISVTDADNMKNTGNRTNTAYVATEVGSFAVNVEYIGKDENLPATGRNIVEWTLKSGSGAEGSDRTITFGADPSETIVLTATSENGTQRDFTIKVAEITAGSVKVFDKVIANGSTTNVTLVKTATKDTYTITKEGDYTYQNDDLVKFNEEITWTYEGTGVDGKSGKDSIKLTGKGSGVLTIKVGTYLTYTVNVTIEDATNFALQPKNMNSFTFLGSKNEVLLSDLFELKGEIPEGSELVVFNGAVQAGDSYMTPKRGKLTNQINATVDNNTQALTNANFSTLKLQFSGEDLNNSVRIAVVHNGVRISEDVTVKIVNAHNIRTFGTKASTANDELDNLVTPSTGNPSPNEIKENVVLLSDIAMDGDVYPMISFVGSTLYGNCFTFDITEGVTSGYWGVISLENAHMRDVRVLGKHYDGVGVAAPDPWGANAVHAFGVSSITNCYISNTRAPLTTGHEDYYNTADAKDQVTVTDTILYGGRYANIEVRDGKLIFAGEVITINQPHTTETNVTTGAASGNTNMVVGLGVTIWLEANDGTGIEGIEHLTQYNFIPNSNDIVLPTIKVTQTTSLKGYNVTITAAMDSKKMFTGVFGNTATYGDYIFGDDVQYMNAGVIGEDFDGWASTLSKPSGNRTGLTAADMSIDFSVTFTTGSSIGDRIINALMSGLPKKVTFHYYAVKNAGTNDQLFADSVNAEFFYSPITQTVNGTDSYVEYDFQNGSILAMHNERVAE